VNYQCLLQYILLLDYYITLSFYQLTFLFERTFNLRYLLWLISNIFQYDAILIPCLKTIPAFTALFSPNLDEQTQKAASETSLEEFLKTKRGFQFFMEHCRREFSEENLMCYHEIEEFHRRTNNENFLKIFNAYFADGAPFPVNLGQKTVRDIRLKEATLSKMDLADLQSTFDAARHELLQLMEGDTYQRFIRSPLFVKYCKGEQLPVSEANTHTGMSSIDESYVASKQSEELELQPFEKERDREITPLPDSEHLDNKEVDMSSSSPGKQDTPGSGRLISATVLDRPSVSLKTPTAPPEPEQVPLSTGSSDTNIDDEYYIQ